jgi:putative transposase
MADNYTELYYHLVWATKGREHYLVGDVERILFGYLSSVCNDLRVRVLALNGMPDHVHLACTIPTSLSIGTLMSSMKGKSSHYINHLPGGGNSIAWQPGYGALTFSKRDLPRVVSYINNQKAHHASGHLLSKLELTSGLE